MNERTEVDVHVERITKRYIIDFLNSFFFAHTVLWDSDDQFNELPIFKSSVEKTSHYEHRGAVLVHKREPRALRLLITATKDTVQSVCYRLTGLKQVLTLDGHKRLYYPLEALALDFSIADSNLGIHEPSSYSVFDNMENLGYVRHKRLFAILQHLINCYYVAIDDTEIFDDLLDDLISFPPLACDPHYLPVYGVKRDVLDHGD